jgi:hypothetical protein
VRWQLDSNGAYRSGAFLSAY